MTVAKVHARDIKIAGADLSGALHCGVVLNANDQFVLAGAGAKPYGIISEAGKQGEGVTVDLEGIVKCRAGAGTIAIGDKVTMAAGGLLVKAASGASSFGVARSKSDVAGTVVAVTVQQGQG